MTLSFVCQAVWCLLSFWLEAIGMLQTRNIMIWFTFLNDHYSPVEYEAVLERWWFELWWKWCKWRDVQDLGCFRSWVNLASVVMGVWYEEKEQEETIVFFILCLMRWGRVVVRQVWWTQEIYFGQDQSDFPAKTPSDFAKLII